MSRALPDASIWTDFFHGNEVAAPLNQLIEEGRILTNAFDHDLSVIENATHFRLVAGLFGLTLFEIPGRRMCPHQRDDYASPVIRVPRGAGVSLVTSVVT